MRILLIESDSSTARSIELMLKAEGFNVYTTDIGEEGADLAKLYDYQAVVLADALVDMRGIDVVRQLRAAKIATPILMLCRGADVADKVAAFRAGADDYLTKPFHRDELVARLHALIRRSAGATSTILTVGPIAVDIAAKGMTVDGQPVHLTGKEYQIIEFLALRKGATQAKEAVMSQLYGGMDEPELKIIDVFICKLRNKLRRFNAQSHIETVWGMGYRLVERPAQKPDKRQPTARDVVSIADAVLGALASGGKTYRQLAEALNDRAPGSIRASVSGLTARGRVVNVGRCKHAVYELKHQAAA